MHPDQKTPDGHRYRSPDSNAPRERAPAQEQELPVDAEITHETVSTPEPEGKRLGEAGHVYTGRPMDDRLQDPPRVEDADRVRGDDEDGD
ncbi:MAG: hypothetical protein R3181_12600 [Rubricoccaceae bacterium]|nr:hypothetical protein [Rubricoccaceae bacterium]